jgi:hypothetical protein
VRLRPRARSPRPHDQTRASRRPLPDPWVRLSGLRRGAAAQVTQGYGGGRGKNSATA